MIFGKFYFYFSRIISQELIIASLFVIKAILKTFLSFHSCIVCREYFSIIFNLKKCALYSIKYGNHVRFCKNIAIENAALLQYQSGEVLPKIKVI